MSQDNKQPTDDLAGKAIAFGLGIVSFTLVVAFATLAVKWATIIVRFVW